MNIVIKAERVKLLRESKKMSQAALANATRLGKRQIQRIEQHEGELPVRENTLNKLAKGLRVNPRVLTGEELMPESTVSDHIGVSAQSSVKTIKLSPHVQLQYDLIKEVVFPPFRAVLKSRSYAAMANFWIGVIPPSAMLGRS